MPRKPGGDRISPLGWWSHSPHEGDILQPDELLGFQVVPASFAHPLSQQFYWRLCAINLLLRHIHVVYEDDDIGLPVLWSEMSFPSLGGHLGLNGELHLVAGGLSRERST